MASPENYLHHLLAAVRQYFAPDRAPHLPGGSHIRRSKAGIADARTGDRAGEIDHHQTKHGPIQITTVHDEPVLTQDGIPVRIAATLAWSTSLHSMVSPRERAIRLAADRSPGRHDDISASSLTREALRTMVPGCGLAALLCDRQDAEELLRRDVARRGQASGLIVHLVRIRTVDIPASVQAAGDARQLLAMQACTERLRKTNKCDRHRPGVTVIGRLTV